MQPPNTHTPSCLETTRVPMEAIYSCLLDFGGTCLLLHVYVCVCLRANGRCRGPVPSNSAFSGTTDEHADYLKAGSASQVPFQSRAVARTVASQGAAT